MEQGYNPEQSPYFSHWRYDGNWLQKKLEVGPKTPIFKTSLHNDVVETWAARRDSGVVLDFANNNPELEVTVEDDDGEKKTVTLPRWARDFERT